MTDGRVSLIRRIGRFISRHRRTIVSWVFFVAICVFFFAGLKYTRDSVGPRPDAPSYLDLIEGIEDDSRSSDHPIEDEHLPYIKPEDAWPSELE